MLCISNIVAVFSKKKRGGRKEYRINDIDIIIVSYYGCRIFSISRTLPFYFARLNFIFFSFFFSPLVLFSHCCPSKGKSTVNKRDSRERRVNHPIFFHEKYLVIGTDATSTSFFLIPPFSLSIFYLFLVTFVRRWWKKYLYVSSLFFPSIFFPFLFSFIFFHSSCAFSPPSFIPFAIKKKSGNWKRLRHSRVELPVFVYCKITLLCFIC